MGRILVADDHDALRRGLVRGLTEAGHEVEEASNGNAAIERLTDSYFDVVLSDLKMGGSDGLDVLRTTRINKGFLGARGLSLPRGLMDLNPDEVRIKQEMADACEQVFAIVDGTKWHRSALLSFVPTDKVSAVIRITAVVGCSARVVRRTSRPSLPPILRSLKTTSK